MWKLRILLFLAVSLVLASVWPGDAIAAPKEKSASAQKKKRKKTADEVPVPTVGTSKIAEAIGEKKPEKEEPKSETSGVAQLTRPQESEQIKGLTLPALEIPVYIDGTKKNLPTDKYVVVTGNFKSTDGSTLIAGGVVIPLGPEGNFKVNVPDSRSLVEFVSVTPNGEVKVEKIAILFPGKRSQPFVNTSMGLTFISYRETRKPDFASTVITLKASYSYLFPSRKWDVDANFFITALPLNSNIAGVSARFFGLNVRFSYAFPMLKEPWSLKVGLGLYYNTMLVSNNSFGYKDLIYPQIFPIASRFFGKYGWVAAYLKFVPLGAGFVPSFSERELAYGVSWRLSPTTLGIEKPWAYKSMATISLDLSSMQFNPTPRTQLGLTTTSLSFGFSYSL